MKKKLRFPVSVGGAWVKRAATAAIVKGAASAALALALLPLAVWAGPVDINSADAKTLARELHGIGLARAQAIVEFREKNGPFKSADDLAKIKGIGAHVIEQNRENIQLKDTAKAAKPQAGAE